MMRVPATAVTLRGADRMRARLLQLFMREPVLRALYVERTSRLTLWTLGVMALNLSVAALAPLWLLAFSPVFWGFPHLIASARYSARVPGSSRPETPALLFLIGFTLCMMALRLGADFFWPSPSLWVFNDRRLEFLGLAFAFVGLGFCLGKGRSRLLSGLMVGSLLAAGLLLPRLLLGLLLFGHHFLAFGMWARAAKTSNEHRRVWQLCFVFAILHLVIFAGGLDFLFNLLPGFMELPFAGMGIGSIGQSIFGDLIGSPIVWFRLVVAFAFGQSVHYFIWLRAIPEQHLPYQTPTSFRQSADWLKKDFGARGAFWGLLLAASLSLVWVLAEFPVARVAYVSLAAFHGFAELAAYFSMGVADR